MCVQLCHYVHNYDVAYHFTTKTLFENKMWKMHYLKNALNKDAEHSSESILLTPCLTAAERPFFPWIHTRTQIISKHKLGEMFGAGERAQEKTSRHLTSKKKRNNISWDKQTNCFLTFRFFYYFLLQYFLPMPKIL